MRYRVTKAHKPDDLKPLVFRKGERLAFERRPTGWEGWVWCISQDGRGGWTPESWLSLEGDACVALRDYDSTELDLNVGDVVLADILESGWARVKDERGRAGWVPVDCLQKV